jgi:hypothetical protein
MYYIRKCVYPDDDLLDKVETCCTIKHIPTCVDCNDVIFYLRQNNGRCGLKSTNTLYTNTHSAIIQSAHAFLKIMCVQDYFVNNEDKELENIFVVWYRTA